MWPLLLTLGLIGAGVGRWPWSQNGRDVLALCRRHPVVFAPAAGVWAIGAIVHAIDSPALKESFLNVNGSGIVLAISVGVAVSMAAHVVALATVLYLCFGRIEGKQPPEFRGLALVALLVMGATWVAFFALLIPFSPMFSDSGLAWVALGVLALTVSNPWHTEVAQGLEQKLDAPLRETLALLTALLSTLFLIAYARPVPAAGLPAGLTDR